MALDHVAALDAKAAEIQAMSRTLRHLADSCHGNDRPQCPIIDNLAQFSETSVDRYRPERGDEGARCFYRHP